MVEWLMLLSIGFLAGTLATLAFVPFVHQRAVRLTMRHLSDATPYAVAEMRADKDRLRAEFAMAVRRLEVSVEEMKAKGANQLVEISRKRAEIADLKAELDRRVALILALQIAPATVPSDRQADCEIAAPSLSPIEHVN
jgi:hypothetical protein